MITRIKNFIKKCINRATNRATSAFILVALRGLLRDEPFSIGVFVEKDASPKEIIRQRILANFDYDNFCTRFIGVYYSSGPVSSDLVSFRLFRLRAFQYFDDNLPCELLPQDMSDLYLGEDYMDILAILRYEMRKHIECYKDKVPLTVHYDAVLVAYFVASALNLMAEHGYMNEVHYRAFTVAQDKFLKK